MIVRAILRLWVLGGFCTTLSAQGARGGFGRMTTGYYHSMYAQPPAGESLKPVSGFAGIGGSGFGRWGERVLIGGGGFGTVDRIANAEGVETKVGFGMVFLISDMCCTTRGGT